MFHIHVALVWFYLFLQDGTQNKSDLKKYENWWNLYQNQKKNYGTVSYNIQINKYFKCSTGPKHLDLIA